MLSDIAPTTKSWNPGKESTRDLIHARATGFFKLVAFVSVFRFRIYYYAMVYADTRIARACPTETAVTPT